MSSIIKELEKEYIEKHPRSRELYQRALKCYPSGVTHDARYTEPFPIYTVKAEGVKKWDVDGNEYIDYIMGHGALLLGYGDERVIAALQDQLPKAIHMGSCTELEIEWAELIQEIIPSARNGLVRATSCGTEAVLMAIRLARSYTGREKVVLHAGCYHGKGDTTIYAFTAPPIGVYNVRGIPKGVRDDVIIIPYNNLEMVEEAFETGSVACIVLQGNAPYTKEYIQGLRRLTHQYGVVFILDEVVSGLRYALGGAQEYYGVTPDLSALGKIVGGGAPIGAICGKAEILDLYSFKDDYWNRFVRIRVGGTWNAQPLTIVGGIATMKILKEERNTIYPNLYRIGKRLTKSFNEEAEDLGVAAIASGLPPENPTTFSLNLLNRPIPPEKLYLWETGPKTFEDYRVKDGFKAGKEAFHANYLSLINNGIMSFKGSSFITCTKHTEEDLRKTEEAFAEALRVLKENRLVGLAK